VRGKNMMRIAVFVTLFLAVLRMSLPAIVAVDDTRPSLEKTSDPKRLLRIIEEQQRRLDAQVAQIEEQRKALQELRIESELTIIQSIVPTQQSTSITEQDGRMASSRWMGSGNPST
jgi:hypothetical protein